MEQKSSKRNRLSSLPLSGWISDSKATPEVPALPLTALATSWLQEVEGAGVTSNLFFKLFVPVDYFLVAWIKQLLQICKPVKGDSYIFALQLFLLTSDHNFLVIGWLAPK